MLASLADAPLRRCRTSSTNRSTTASAPLRRSKPGGRRPPVVAAREREDLAISGDRRGARGRGRKRRREPVVLDGEIVALDAKGKPAGFQQLQGRIHVKDERRLSAARRDRRSSPSTCCATARTTCATRRCRERATRSKRLVHRRHGSSLLRISEQVARRRPRALRAGARERVGRADREDTRSLYKSGKRTPDWRKLKIVHEQEFVIGGWTEPRQTRAYFGALLLGSTNGTRSPRLCRSHRHRLQRAGARARDEAAEAARNEDVPVRERSRNRTSVRTGCGRSWSRRSSSPNGPPTASSGIRSISACATTRSRRDVRREDRTRLHGVGRPGACVEAAANAERRRADGRRTPQHGPRRTPSRGRTSALARPAARPRRRAARRRRSSCPTATR